MQDSHKDIGSPDDVSRLEAAVAISMSVRAKEAVPVLVEFLKHRDVDLRARAMAALIEVGQPADTEMDAIIAALGDVAPIVRRRAAVALGEIGGESEPAISALTRSLGDGDGAVRRFAAAALGDIGPAASAAVPSLERAWRSDDEKERAVILAAIKKIQPEAVAKLGVTRS